jgi:hypothetical protein
VTAQATTNQRTRLRTTFAALESTALRAANVVFEVVQSERNDCDVRPFQ